MGEQSPSAQRSNPPRHSQVRGSRRCKAEQLPKQRAPPAPAEPKRLQYHMQLHTTQPAFQQLREVRCRQKGAGTLVAEANPALNERSDPTSQKRRTIPPESPEQGRSPGFWRGDSCHGKSRSTGPDREGGSHLQPDRPHRPEPVRAEPTPATLGR